MIFLQFYTFPVVRFLSVLTLAGGIMALVLFFMLLFKPKNKLTDWIEKNALILMFIVAFIAVCGSLFFSEIANWTPCKDCWFQRIFMYPQVILLAVALWKKDKNIAPYILALCIIGMMISIDHYSDQVSAAFNPGENELGVNVLQPCDTTGISCAATQIHFYFGYITIPMMALTAFVLNALGSIFMMHRRPKMIK